MFIAHRGKVTNLSKENTLEAFIEAINDPKYLGFELDIRTTKDKRFVCIFTIEGFTSIFLNDSAFLATSQLALISSII